VPEVRGGMLEAGEGKETGCPLSGKLQIPKTQIPSNSQIANNQGGSQCVPLGFESLKFYLGFGAWDLGFPAWGLGISSLTG
jgi:hypothetical protein